MVKKTVFCLFFLLSNVVLAGSMGALPSWSKLATLSLGPVYSNPGQTQTFFLQPDYENTYLNSDNTDVLISGELFLGVQRPIGNLLLGQFGFAAAIASPAKLNGLIWDDADPNENNSIYNYHIQHEHVAIKAKLLPNAELDIAPYISGSLGVGFNRAYDFSITPIIAQEPVPPLFTANSTIAFTYTLGAGFQKSFNEHWQAGMGYEFTDWGRSVLGRSSGQTLNSGLELNHLYTQELLFSITYLAGA